MNKKAAALGIETIIIVILALVVLVILIVLISGQIRKSSQSYTEIGEEAAQEAKLTSCKGGLFKVRQCSSGPPSDDFYWNDAGSLDCGSGLRCYERGEAKS